MSSGLESESNTRPESESNTQLESQLAALVDRIERLEAELERKDDRIERLEQKLETHDDRLESHGDCLESTEDRLESTEDRLERHTQHLERVPTTCEKLTDHRQSTERALEAIGKKVEANKSRIRELQSRELEKGAHLETATVEPAEVDVHGGHLERVTKADGTQCYRLPEQADPLERGELSLAYGDLLPIQQLARMDDEMVRSAANALPTRLAATLWRARTDSSVGDNPWRRGCKTVAEYVTASDLKHWIRRQEAGISDTYAKKLVSRVIDSMLELSKHRLAVRKRTERKNGLEYTERRLVLPTDADIPGERPTESE